MQNAAKVGALVVVFVALLIGAYTVLGRSIFQTPTAKYYATFPDASGLKPGTPILVAGVSVGTVGSVELVDTRTARATLLMKPDLKVPADSRAVIPSSLIGFGDAPLELVPGTSATVLMPEGTLQGSKAGPLDKILPNAAETMVEMNALLKEVRLLIADKTLQSDVKKVLSSSEKTITSFGALAARLDRVMAQNEGQVSLALVKGTQAIADAQRVTSAVAELMEKGTLQRDGQAIVAQLKETTKKADALVANMNALVTDPNIKSSLAQVNELTIKGNQIATNVEKLTASAQPILENTEKISRQGITISENIADLTERSKKVIDGAYELEKKLGDLLDKVNGALGRGGKPSVPAITSEVEMSRDFDLDRFRTDFNASIPIGKDRLHFGIYDGFESNKLTLQYGQSFSATTGFRYGMFAGKAGFGVDSQISPKWGLRADMWDLNNPRLDARLRVELGKGFYGWAGVDRAFQENRPVIGIGIRK